MKTFVLKQKLWLKIIVFTVEVFFVYWTHKVCWVTVLPFIYVFGNFILFQEFMTLIADLIDIFGLYFLIFIFIATIAFYRNYKFQIFNGLCFLFSTLYSFINSCFKRVNAFFCVIFIKIKNFFKSKKK